MYSCDLSGVSQCPLYGVENVSRRLEHKMYAKINRCFLICTFYGGCPHVGMSVN